MDSCECRRGGGREVFSERWLSQGQCLQSCGWESADMEPHYSTLWPRYCSEVRRTCQPAWFRFENLSEVTLELLLDGVLDYCQDGVRDLVRPGELYVIHPGTNTRFQQSEKEFFHRWRVMLRGKLVPVLLSSLRLNGVRRIRVRHPEDLAGRFQDIMDVMKQKSPLAGPEVSHRCYGLLMALSAESRGTAEYPVEMARLIRAMEDDGGFTRTLGELSEECRCSIHTLMRQFRRHLGTTPATYRERIRLERARELLQTTGLPVKAIAAELGYCDQLYFATAFKRHFQQTPSACRMAGRLPKYD